MFRFTAQGWTIFSTGPKSAGDVRWTECSSVLCELKSLRMQKGSPGVAHEIYSSFGAKRTPRTPRPTRLLERPRCGQTHDAISERDPQGRAGQGQLSLSRPAPTQPTPPRPLSVVRGFYLCGCSRRAPETLLSSHPCSGLVRASGRPASRDAPSRSQEFGPGALGGSR